MKKLFTILLLSIVTITSTFAGGRYGGYRRGGGAAFEQGTNLLSLSYGIYSIYSPYGSYVKALSTTTGTSSIGPVGLTFEHGITDNFGAGAMLNYSTWRYSYSLFGTTVKTAFNTTYLTGFGSYHISVNDKIDPYAQAGLTFGRSGYSQKIITTQGTTNTNSLAGFNPTTITFYGVAGCRFYVNDQFGLFVQAGYGASSAASVGATIKL
jgi:hypothetical protein